MVSKVKSNNQDKKVDSPQQSLQAHTQDAKTVMDKLSVTANGLSENAVKQHREKYGENTLTQGKKVSFFKRLLESLKDPMIILLAIAGLITLTVNIVREATLGDGEFYECIGIFATIALSVIITMAMEGKSAKAFEALNSLGENVKVRVVRDGNPVLVDRKDIVVGDIAFLESGNKTVFDARLINCTSLSCDESALTGEAEPVDKQTEILKANAPIAERTNMVYSGSYIVSGSATAVVTAVGDATEFGKIAQALTQTSKDDAPLNRKLAKLGKLVALIGAIAAVVAFIAELIIARVQFGTLTAMAAGDALISSIMLIVAAVPEGLPTIMAVSLALNVIKMAKQNALVKKMIATETIGCVNVICSDKTGTLTQNRMKLVDYYLADLSHADLSQKQNSLPEIVLQNFTLNSTADIKNNNGKTEFLGNPTECALLTCALSLNRDYTHDRENTDLKYVYSFSSQTKIMTTITQNDVVLVKGSPERVLELCQISETAKSDALAAIGACQSKAQRVIAFAHKTLDKSINDFKSEREEVESDLIFDGFCAIEDPLRDDVYDAIASCRAAGIRVMTLTGDNIVTATAIAEKLGLTDNGMRAVNAADLEQLNDEEFTKELETIGVIARSTPSLKMRVVKALQKQKNIVAVTGDGINDAPALKSADVGIAMGITGTEVTKQAADIVLLDDSFTTIEKSVRWGRGIYDNFRRFLKFQLTVNFAALAIVLTSVFSLLGAPFTALQLLWINLVMDGPAALTIGLEPIKKDVMQRKPVSRDAPLLDRMLITDIAISGIFMTVIFMLQYSLDFLNAGSLNGSALFTLFVFMQIFNAFGVRDSQRAAVCGLNKNIPFVIAMIITIAIQIIITTFGGKAFNCAPLPILLWVKVIALAITPLLLGDFIKLVKFLTKKHRANKLVAQC